MNCRQQTRHVGPVGHEVAIYRSPNSKTADLPVYLHRGLPTDAEVVLGAAAAGVHQFRVSVRISVELAVIHAGHLIPGAVAVLQPWVAGLVRPVLAAGHTCRAAGAEADSQDMWEQVLMDG